MHIEFETAIDAPQERVWALLTTPERVKEWAKNVEDITHQTGEPGAVGSTSISKVSEGGKVNDYLETVLQIEDGHSITISMDGGNLGAHAMRVKYDLRSIDGATNLLYTADWKPSGWMKILAPMIKKLATRGAVASMGSLKDLAEEPH